MDIKRYKKKQEIIEAVEVTAENFKEVANWIGVYEDSTHYENGILKKFGFANSLDFLNVFVGVGEYVYRDANGGFGVYSSDLLHGVYELISED